MLTHSNRTNPRRPLLFALTIAAALLAALFVLAACGSSAETAPDPWARFRPALKPEFQSDLDHAATMPVYDIVAALDADALQLTGAAHIRVPNTSRDPWTKVVFRLYPMLEHYGGEMVVQSTLVDGKPATFVYTNDNTALEVSLDRPLVPGRAVDLDLTWRLSIPSWTDSSSLYRLFGRSQQMISLPLFYPSLAVYQEGPAIGSGRWWLSEGAERGDAAFNVASLFAVSLTLPVNWAPVTSGTLVATTPISATATAHAFVTGPAREFVLHTSPLFQAVSGDTYGTRVTSYYLPGAETAGRAALKFAQQSLAIYSDHFGEYPFTDMRVAPAPIAYRGMEYPQAIFLGVELYTRFRENLEVLTVHEMAHQWWYNIVHNDPVSEPWLDEALAEFAVMIYMENMRGADDAGVLAARRWQTPLDSLIARGEDTAVNQAVPDFRNGNQYETIVYGKGALFYDRLRAALGTRRFDRFLQNYVQEHRWGIVDTETWLAALADLPDPALRRLFEEWINQPRPQVQTTGS
jgi:hypothetical protein